MDDIIKAISDNETNAPSLFSESERKNWGVFFCDRSNPLSYSSNHAVLKCGDADIHAVSREVTEYYGRRGLIPRIELCPSFEYDEAVLKALAESGFKIEFRGNIVCMINTCAPKCVSSRPLKIERQSQWDGRIVLNIIGAGYDEYMPTVIEKSMKGENFNLFVAYLFGEPVSMCAVTVGERVSALHSVMTGMGFRGCGFAAKTVSFAVREYGGISDKPLYLLTDNPSAVPMYSAAGFSKIDFPDRLVSASKNIEVL